MDSGLSADTIKKTTMSRPDNPRFPHWCRIVRQGETTALVDEKVVYDPLADDADVCGCSVSEDDALEGGQTSGDETASEVETQGDAIVVYEGCCRAYDKHTTSDRGEVITSYRGLSLPMAREDWQQIDLVPMEGDTLIVDRGGYKEYGIVVDKNPANFRGTHLIWRYVRN